MRQIVEQRRIGRYMGRSRMGKAGMEWLHWIEYRYVYDHEGD